MNDTMSNSGDSKQNVETYGFGVPKATLAPHHFIVTIPKATRGNESEVLITEDLGMHEGINDPVVMHRVLIPRTYWSEVSNPVKRAFNERLKTHNLRTSSWKTGRNPVDRLLGKELCVLGWAIEEIEAQRLGRALRNWLALRPEERWWLFGMVAATTEGLHDRESGWRIALRYALGYSQESRTTAVSRNDIEQTLNIQRGPTNLSLFDKE